MVEKNTHNKGNQSRRRPERTPRKSSIHQRFCRSHSPDCSRESQWAGRVPCRSRFQSRNGRMLWVAKRLKINLDPAHSKTLPCEGRSRIPICPTAEPLGEECRDRHILRPCDSLTPPCSLIGSALRYQCGEGWPGRVRSKGKEYPRKMWVVLLFFVSKRCILSPFLIQTYPRGKIFQGKAHADQF